MVIVQILGGLGNQMFQYALGRALSLQNETSLFLDISEFSKYKLRRYELGVFNAKPQTVGPILGLRLKALKKSQPLQKLFGVDNFSFYSEKSFPFDPEVLQQRRSVYLAGYWQSEKYFKQIRSVLLEDFKVAAPISAKNQEYLDLINNSNSVSLHIRRGDYVSNAHTQNFHGVLPLTYYRDAIEDLRKSETNLHFFVFSDDPEWVHDNLKVEGEINFIGHNLNQGQEDLRLMQNCRHNIIANSSFSWWGAWLNQNPDKKVYAPNPWFRDTSNDTRDLLPPSWIRMNL